MQNLAGEAAAWIAQVEAWESSNLAVYGETRDTIRELDADPEYHRALIDYEAARTRLEQTREERDSLEVAREATRGRERRDIRRRIDVKESEIRQIRRELRRIMGRVNTLREDAGLSQRDAPYGME